MDSEPVKRANHEMISRSIIFEKRQGARAAKQLGYGEECVEKINNAETISEIYRILQTYREAE